MTPGKQFEKDFKASILDDQFFLRLKDAKGWAKSDDTKFTSDNIADNLVFANRTLYIMELKSHKGKSIPEKELVKVDKQNRRSVDKLAEINYVGTIPCYVCNFRDCHETWLVGAETVRAELEIRKSLSIATCREYGLHIPQKKLRVHWRYDLSVL